MNSVLAVIGVFLIGAAAGAIMTYARYRKLVALCKDMSTGVHKPQGLEGLFIAGYSGESLTPPAGERASASGHAFKKALKKQEKLDFLLWADNLLTCLGAPLQLGDAGRMLTMAERVEWLQAHYG